MGKLIIKKVKKAKKIMKKAKKVVKRCKKMVVKARKIVKKAKKAVKKVVAKVAAVKVVNKSKKARVAAFMRRKAGRVVRTIVTTIIKTTTYLTRLANKRIALKIKIRKAKKPAMKKKLVIRL